MRAVRESWSSSAALTILGLVSVLAAVATAGALAFDDTRVLGQPALLKPLKFFASTVAYSLTLAWLAALVPDRWRRRARIALTVGACAWAVELALIVAQGVRGVPSHFNDTTALDGFVWMAMGATAAVLWLSNLIVVGLLLGEPERDRLRSLALRYGLGLAVVGMAVGLAMPLRFDNPAVELPGGGVAQLAGAHAVGVPDDGPGLPVLGWSTGGGDLRVGHFVGLHGLQALPLAAWLLARRRGLTEGHRERLLAVTAAGYLGLVALVTWQALRGQPLLAPDAATAAAAAVLVVGVAAAAASVLRPARVPAAAG